MRKNTYEMIPINKPIENDKLLENVVIYLYSRLKECQIETNVEGNTYTILASPKLRFSKKTSKTVYLTLQMIIHKDSCSVHFSTSKVKPNMNFAIAVCMAPISLPVSGVMLGSGLLRLWNHKIFQDDVIKYIRTYVS
ncbi:MAG: hypothetical protein NC433_10360 [Clostridiales bacterium]|nr:hypothetical protein [Clostridiales bacterium]